MKSLKQYINEANQNIVKTKGITVIYNVVPENFVLEIPNTYSESDMQIYLDNILLNKLPGSTEKSKEILSTNIEYLNDAYFEYNGFNVSDVSNRPVILDWDKNYDNSSQDYNLVYYTLKNLKYKLIFSEFSIGSEDKPESIVKNLEKLFESLQSNYNNKYPIEIKFETIEFNE